MKNTFKISPRLSAVIRLGRVNSKRDIEKKAFTPLDPESSGFQTGDEGSVLPKHRDKSPALRGGALTGFTLLEVLFAVFILAFCLTAIFGIFFSSLSAINHIKNRFDAGIFIGQEKWKVVRLINKKEINTDYAYQERKQAGILFVMDVKVKKVANSKGLYNLNIKATWDEGRKTKSLSKQIYYRMKGS